MKVKCKSGLEGEQHKLRTSYESFEEFEHYPETYGLARRLGFQSANQAWQANPTIQSSVEPSDFRIVKTKNENEN